MSDDKTPDVDGLFEDLVATPEAARLLVADLWKWTKDRNVIAMLCMVGCAASGHCSGNAAASRVVENAYRAADMFLARQEQDLDLGDVE